jgi:hypothetical protein
MRLSVRHFAELVGRASLGDVAAKLGLKDRPLSTRDMIGRFGPPLAPILNLSWLVGGFPKHPVEHPPDSHDVPVNIEGGVTLEWRDPGRGLQRTATRWEVHFKQGNEAEKILGLDSPSVGFDLRFSTVCSWSVVPENEFGIGASSPTFLFTTARDPSRPPPPPPPPPPQNLVGISKLSLFNCHNERHTIFVWVRDVTGNGPWGLIQIIPTQFNESGQCPFDENGILADSEAILTVKGEGGGFACTGGNIYQVSIVDPERPTCEGRNDPTIGNCVVEDQALFFKFDQSQKELTLMLEDGRLLPAPV